MKDGLLKRAGDTLPEGDSSLRAHSPAIEPSGMHVNQRTRNRTEIETRGQRRERQACSAVALKIREESAEWVWIAFVCGFVRGAVSVMCANVFLSLCEFWGVCLLGHV